MRRILPKAMSSVLCCLQQGYQWMKEKILSEEGHRQQMKLKELQTVAERLGCTLPQLAIGKSCRRFFPLEYHIDQIILRPPQNGPNYSDWRFGSASNHVNWWCPATADCNQEEILADVCLHVYFLLLLFCITNHTWGIFGLILKEMDHITQSHFEGSVMDNAVKRGKKIDLPVNVSLKKKLVEILNFVF